MQEASYIQRQRIEELNTRLNLVHERLELLEDTGKRNTSAVGPQAVQLVRGGDFEHSWDTHEHPAPVADDTRFEAWQIYSHAAPVAGQQLKEDSVFSGALVAASTALPDAGRSDAPTLDPDWKKSDGYARLGSLRSLDFALKDLPAFPGRLLYLSFICAKRSANVAIPGRLCAGIYDNTAGQRDFLQAAAFTITGATVGVPAATVSRDYLIVGYSDYSQTIASAVRTVANAPTDPSFISGQVYVRLSWLPVAGIINWDIFRNTGGVYVYIGSTSTITEFFDQGAVLRAEAGYPSTTATNQTAVAKTAQGALDSIAIDGVSPKWSTVDLAIQIPSTYNKGLTTNKQWLRIFFDAALTGTDAAHGMLMDLVCLSKQSGAFSNHPDDTPTNGQNPASSPSGSSQGGAGGGGSYTPPSPGSGGPRDFIIPFNES